MTNIALFHKKYLIWPITTSPKYDKYMSILEDENPGKWATYGVSDEDVIIARLMAYFKRKQLGAYLSRAKGKARAGAVGKKRFARKQGRNIIVSAKRKSLKNNKYKRVSKRVLLAKNNDSLF
jgi:hypothetical protein